MLILISLLIPFAVAAEFNTVDELEKAYDDRTCRVCHEKVYDEWKKSLHSQSVIHTLGGIRNFMVFGLGKWDKPVNKENLMRCLHCHAPSMENASEALFKEVGELVISAFDGKEEAREKLSLLNVNCIVCHNTHAIIEKNLRGEPKKNVYYGPTGKATPAHGTEKSPAITASIFCSQCHWLFTPKDGDSLYCNTLYGSYQDAYRGTGGTATCQDCHMKSKGRGHTFPGAYNLDMVREGIGLEIQAAGVKLQPGKGIPTAIVTIGLTNNAGHRIPDG
jgi:hypothetical protein